MEPKEINLLQHNSSFYGITIEVLVIALVILTPIAFFPHCITVFNPIKEAIIENIALLSLMFWTLKMISREEIKFTSVPLNFPVLSFILIGILSLIWTNSFFVSLTELPLFLSGPLLYLVLINNLNNKRQVNYILNTLIAVAGLFGIYGILQYNGIDFSLWKYNVGRQQVFGLFGNVNFFAEYLIIPLPIAISLFFASPNKLKKGLLLIGILAMSATLILTFTRGSNLGFGASLIFMFFLFIYSKGNNFIRSNKKILIIILLVLITTAIFLFIVPNPLNKEGTIIFKIKDRISLSRLSTEKSFNRRLIIWKFTALMIKDHPLLGSGIGTFKYNSLRYQAKYYESIKNRSLVGFVGFADKTHNEYLQFWAELGIIGLGIFIWLIISYFNYGLKYLRKIKNSPKQGIIIGLMGSVIAVLIDGIFGFPLHLPTTVILFWLALALTIIIGKSDLNETNIDNMGNNSISKDTKKVIEKKEISRDDRIKSNGKNIIRGFKPLLYILIISLSIYLCFAVTRPFVARIYWFHATKELSKNNLNEAIKINEKALKWDPYLGEIYYDIGKVLQSKKIYTITLEYFQKAAKYCDSPDLPKDFAVVYLMRNQLEEAAVKLKQAISYQKTDQAMLPLYCDLGSIYLRLKRHDLAEIALKKALQINTDYANAHFRLGGVYLEQKKITEAQEEFQKVIELAPDSPEAKNAQEMINRIIQEKARKKLEEKKPD
jgi:O-antigen ligase/tetratricopeptide (TPR) repeat protein